MDRLGELKKQQTPGDTQQDLEMGAIPAADVDGPMKEFYQEVDFLKEKMKRVEANIKAIDEAYTQELTTISADKADELTKKLEALIGETNKESQVIAARLKQMGATNKANASKGSNAEQRMRESLHATLAKKFYELMAAYQVSDRTGVFGGA
jgi:t-SNARE complex subunit (syntaxin)